MKAYKVIYKHGHFIDLDTQQRILPVQGSEYTITAFDNSFKTEDAKLRLGNTLDSIQKLDKLKNEFGDGNFTKILNSGDKLFFRVGNSKRMDDDESKQYIFICTLLEDLYIYLMKGKKVEEIKNWRLYDCKCVLDSCLLGGLTLSAKIPANSLNALFSHTVQFYFSMQRSGATNVFNTFMVYEPGMQISFDNSSEFQKLAYLRENYVNRLLSKTNKVL